MSQDVVPCRFGVAGRVVDVSRAVFLISDEVLLAQDAENRPDCRVGGWIRKLIHDLGDSRLGAAIEDVHHLPLSARQGCSFGLLGHGSRGQGYACSVENSTML